MIGIKSIFHYFLLFFFAVSCMKSWGGNSGVRDRRDLTPIVSHLRGHVYIVEDSNYWKTNSVFYSSDEGIVFFDATWTQAGASRVIWKAAAYGRGDYLGIFLTDDRLFRTGGLSQFELNLVPVFTRAPVFHALRTDWFRYQQEMSASFGSWLASPGIKLSNVSSLPPSLLDEKIRFIPVEPAFSPGNFLVYFTEEKILYGGSLLSIPLYFRERIEIGAYRSVLEEVKKLNPETVISGHGNGTYGSEFPDLFLKEIQSHYPGFNPL